MAHGVFFSEKATGVSVPVVAGSGIPFVIGASPVHCAQKPAAVGVPVLCTSWSEAVEKLGYSDNWADYPLCEFMYSHFKLFGCQPVIFENLLDPAKMFEEVPAADHDVVRHQVSLPLEAIGDGRLIVKAAGGTGEPLVLETDYSVYCDGERLVVEAIPGGGCYDAARLSLAYRKVTPGAVDDTAVATGLEGIEQCLTAAGIVPDLICAPGHSGRSSVAAVMAAKAAGINGMFKAKALIDINCGASGAKSYTEAVAAKGAGNLADKGEILGWPMLRLGERRFHLSTQLAGLMAQVDTKNGGCPFESPSNKGFSCDGLVLADGSEVNLTLAQANILNENGICTSLNFLGGRVCWGNYTACYPAVADVKDFMLPVSRMFGWVGNTAIRTFWAKLDNPMNRRLRDSIVDSLNIWLNGLVGAEYLLGARAEFVEAENPPGDLMAGIVRTHIYMTPPSPAQEIDFIAEYSAAYVASALQ